MDVPSFLNFVAAHQQAMARAKELYADRVAPAFGVFDFIDDSELGISRLIAWLLDPRGTHAQNDRFLDLFLKQVGLNWSKAKRVGADVRTEVSIGPSLQIADQAAERGRIDILVRSSNAIIAIENKSNGAPDQPGQLSRYLLWLTKNTSSEFRLIYLTPHGSQPPEHSLSTQALADHTREGQLLLWSLPADLVAWLKRCQSASKAHRVTWLIDEFIRYINATYEGVADLTNRDHLVAEIVARPEAVRPAMELLMAGVAVRESLINKLAEQIRAGMKAGCKLDVWTAGDRYSPAGLMLTFDEQTPIAFCLEFQSHSFNNAQYGVCWRSEEFIADNTRWNAVIAQHLGHGEQSEWWPWRRVGRPADEYLPMERNWGAAVDPWVDIASGKLSATFLDTYKRVEEAVLSAVEPRSQGL